MHSCFLRSEFWCCCISFIMYRACRVGFTVVMGAAGWDGGDGRVLSGEEDQPKRSPGPWKRPNSDRATPRVRPPDDVSSVPSLRRRTVRRAATDPVNLRGCGRILLIPHHATAGSTACHARRDGAGKARSWTGSGTGEEERRRDPSDAPKLAWRSSRRRRPLASLPPEWKRGFCLAVLGI